MTTLLLLLGFPLLWPLVAKVIWKQELTLYELGINLVVGVLIVMAGWGLGQFMQMTDIEILNGAVSAKHSEDVSCSHSYSCNCVKSCDSKGSCSETCSTCYDHPFDRNWLLETSVGQIEIDRVNRQGTVEPPRFSSAKIGDSVAVSHRYTNYIKASPDSLFNTQANKQLLATYQSRIPAYPDKVYDYHYVDRVLTLGMTIPDVAAWNSELAARLKTLGPTKQANVVLVFTKDTDPQFAEALRVAWLGGKKNDVTVVLGTPEYPSIAWARVISWTDKEVFKVQLRDALLDLKTVDKKAILDVIEQETNKGFLRKRMADFAYLKELIEPPTWVLALVFLMSTVASIWTSVVLSRNTSQSSGFRGFSRLRQFR